MRVRKGNTAEFNIDLKLPDTGETYVLTENDIAEFTVRKDFDEPIELRIVLTADDYVNGNLILKIFPEETANMTAGKYVYDIALRIDVDKPEEQFFTVITTREFELRGVVTKFISDLKAPGKWVPEAPADGSYYARRNRRWAKIPEPKPGGGSATEIEMGDSFTVSNPQGLMQGVTISKTDDVFGVLKRMLRQAEPPAYLSPLLSIAGSPASGTHEIGSNLTPTLLPTFTQRNGGAPIQRRIMRGGAVINTASTVTSFTDAQFQLITETTYSAAVDFGQGEILNDSLGEPDPTGRIEAGTVTSGNVSYTPVRRAFFGALNISNIPQNSNDVRALPQNILNPVNGSALSANISAGSGQLIAFVYPATLRAPTSVMDGGLNVLAGYTQTIIQVAGANNAASVDYRLIFTTNAVGAPANRTVTLNI
jgi:hypothetical protein